MIMKQENSSGWNRENLKDPHRLPDKSLRIKTMFGRIARTYDLLNHLLSLNLDRRWRRRAVALARAGPGQSVLDLCCGTGDLALEFLTQHPDLGELIGIDFAEPMLIQAAAKSNRWRNAGKTDRCNSVIPKWLCGDVGCLPFMEARFDIVGCAFGMRNLQDVFLALRQIHRVLKPGGKILILEFALPHHKFIAWLYKWYFRLVLPLIGNIIAKDRHRAYQYLPASVERFETASRLSKLLQKTGFGVDYMEELSWAAVLVLVASKS